MELHRKLTEILASFSAAQTILERISEKILSAKTVADYRKKVERLQRKGLKHGLSAWQGALIEMERISNKLSFHAYRAACQYCARAELQGAFDLAKVEWVQIKEPFRAAHTRGESGEDIDCSQCDYYSGCIAELIEVLDALPAILLPPLNRRQRQSKTAVLKKLHAIWREQITEAMPQYSPAILVLALTGCRPCELVTGVDIQINGEFVTAYIHGAKVNAKLRKGQEWRRLFWPLDHPHQLVQDLIQKAKEAGGAFTAKIESATNLGSAVRHAGHRLWPNLGEHITPYVFRHALASDLKASGLSAADISACLGHRVTKTATNYGRASAAKGLNLAPCTVEAASEVRVKLGSKSAQKFRAERTLAAAGADIDVDITICGEVEERV